MDAPLKPQAPSAPPAPSGPSVKPKDDKIVTIPESYYGVALKMEPPFYTDEDTAVPTPAPPPAPTPAPPAPSVVPGPLPPPVEQHSRLAMVVVVLSILLVAGGGWVAWNREAIFRKPRTSTVTLQKPATPNPATDLMATSTAPGVVRLEWVDRSESEAGYRIERRGSMDSGFVAVQTLPANSRTFLDPSAVPESRVSYRVTAFNEGGEAPSSPAEVLVQARPAQMVSSAPTLPPDGLDLDSDGLTDSEEAVFGSNAQLPDTDSDGYLDANEVFNLYAPTIQAPAILLTQTMMQTVSSTIGWQLLAPKAWTIERAPNGTDVLIRVPSGEVFVVTVEANPTKQDIRTWIATTRGWRVDQVVELRSNKYQLSFYLGPDRLTAYIPWDGQVVRVSYQLGTQVFVNYRTTFGMILNSLRLQGSPKVPDLSRPTEIPSIFKPEALLAVPTSTTATTTSAIIPSSTLSTPAATSTTSTQP